MQRTVFLFITRYEDDKVAIYKEGTEIQSLYFWRTTDELKCFTTCVTKYKQASKNRISALRTTDFRLWNTNLEHGTECIAD